MARRLLNLVTLLSLLLCVAVVGLWVRSFWVTDEFTYTSGPTRSILATADGGIDLTMTDDEVFQQVPQSWTWRRFGAPFNDRSSWRRSIASPQNPYAVGPWHPPRLGFWWGRHVGPDPSRPAGVPAFFLIGPIWPLALPWAILPALRAAKRGRRAFRHRLRDQGLCPACGYNLTANVSGVCPECGVSNNARAVDS